MSSRIPTKGVLSESLSILKARHGDAVKHFLGTMSRVGATRRWSPLKQRGDRLKDVNLDPLETLGLPSKGDNRLLDFQTQEDYYGKIVQRHEEFCAGSGDSLDDAFTSLSLNGTSANDSSPTKNSIEKKHAHLSMSHGPNYDSKELSIILMAMRKIREAIVSSARKDAFALQAYMFIIRATILAKHMESYHPALLHLLRGIHPVTPLTASEYNEFLGYYILDLACRQNDLAAAYRSKYYYIYKNNQVVAIVNALVHGDWCSFWKIKSVVTVHQKRLMEWVEEGMRSRALGCIGKSYLSVDKKYLEKATQLRWEEVVEENNMGWQLEGDVVIIRRIKAK